MDIEPKNREHLIQFAREQMARKGEIDSLIFTTHNLEEGLKKASDSLAHTAESVRLALSSIQEENSG